MRRKLVRDKIPARIRADGKDPKERKLSASEYRAALLDKLVEEAEEARKTKGSMMLVEELADIHQVIVSIHEAFDISPKHVARVRIRKFRERGGFRGRIEAEVG